METACEENREIGNGQIVPAKKRGFVHHLGWCPKCKMKTWSKPFKFIPMTKTDVDSALKKSVE